jgi:hypothetical protein
MEKNMPRPCILGLFAEPLVYPSGAPVARLDLDQEREDITAWLEDADADIDFEPGSLDEFQKALSTSVSLLHFSGHGNEKGLLIEDENGKAQLLRREDLAGILASYSEGNLRLAFLSACRSEEACRLVVDARVPFVVGILRHQLIGDDAARQFARAFYRSLAQGRSIGRAFEAAKAGVRAAYPSEADKFVLHARSGANPDTEVQFQSGADGQGLRLIAKAESLLLGVPQTGPFFGRAYDIGSLIEQAREHRFVSITGTGGSERVP